MGGRSERDASLSEWRIERDDLSHPAVAALLDLHLRAAHALYERAGFVECDPFADYIDRVHARYYTLLL